MSGHSKWANIKHKKQKEDAARGKMFSKITREIMVAVREGGPDPDANFRLRLAVDKARSVNMPGENIERAIRRASGESDSESYEEVIYEGYGPGGAALLLQILTDNRNRTASDMRYIFSKHGGNLGESGCVAWMFDKKGFITIKGSDGLDEDKIMTVAIEVGAEDVRFEDGNAEIITGPSEFREVCSAFEKAGIAIESAEITMLPKTTVELSEKDADRVLNLVEALEDHDDVQEVYVNIDLPDDTDE